MPNWFNFSLNVSGEKKDVEQFVENVKGSEKFETQGREFDFNHFIPQPENLYRDSLSTDKEKELESQGLPNWYTWNNANWGTKWNAVCDDFEQYDYPSVTYNLRTAWAFPNEVIAKMIDMYSPKLAFIITGEEESNAYGVHVDSVLDIWEEEEPIMVDDMNDKEVFYETDTDLWRYVEDNEIVEDQDDFYPMAKYSWY